MFARYHDGARLASCLLLLLEGCNNELKCTFVLLFGSSNNMNSLSLLPPCESTHVISLNLENEIWNKTNSQISSVR